MLKRWCSIKEIEVYSLREISISKDKLQGQNTAASYLKGLMTSWWFLRFLVKTGIVKPNKNVFKTILFFETILFIFFLKHQEKDTKWVSERENKPLYVKVFQNTKEELEKVGCNSLPP